MENIFADELGHTMLTALKELGEGINKLTLLEKNFSNYDIEEFNVLKIVESVTSSPNVIQTPTPPPRGLITSKIKLPSFNTDEDIPPPPLSPINLLNEQEQNQHENKIGFDQDTILSKENVSIDIDNNENHHNKIYENKDFDSNDDDNHNQDENSHNNDNNNNNSQDDQNSYEEDENGDDDDDEWENDDDLGYILIPISEQDFFEMEEEVTFRHNLGKNFLTNDNDEEFDEDDEDDKDNNNENNNEDSEDKEKDDEIDHELELNSQQSNQEFEHYDELNQSFLRQEESDEHPINSSEVMILDLRAHSPELSTDFVETNESGGSVEEGEDHNDALEKDIVEVTSQLNLNSENYLNHTFNNQSPNSQAQNGSISKVSHSNRRETEIWGQRKIIGVDGDHRYFDLKIIFEPYRTGFEEDKNFHPTPGTIIAGRYEVAEMLGQAAFSTAWQCVDLKAEGVGNEWVCLKVIKNSKDFFDQSLDEIKLLQYINSKGDPHQHNVLKMIDFFYCKEHLFIVSELLRENLYEFGKYIRESGAKEYFTLPRLKKIMKQILEALVYIHSLNLIHCDIKPENIVIKSYSRCEVKLIDFGSSCFTTDHLTSYIQSRSYRAPEVILGLDYGPGIDIWSLGGVLAEMHTGYVLFQNDSLATMLARIQGILGPYPSYVLEQGREVNRYFSSSGAIYERSEDGEGNTSLVLIYPKKTTLRHRLHLMNDLTDEETKFLDFVGWMLHLDPNKRPSAGQALLHPWFDDVDTIDVSYIDT